MKSMMVLAGVVVASMAVGGCKEETVVTPPAPPVTTTTGPVVKAEGEHHNHIPIGHAKIGDLTLSATTDGPVSPGGEGAFDVTITGGAKPKAVRFWVGGELGTDSLKAKADEESPGVWHTHVEIPKPLPPGSKFWVEVETIVDQKGKASFELKLK